MRHWKRISDYQIRSGKIMTEGKLQKIIDLKKAIAICECIIGDLQEGVWVSLSAADGPGRFPQPTARQIQRRIPENVRG